MPDTNDHTNDHTSELPPLLRDAVHNAARIDASLIELVREAERAGDDRAHREAIAELNGDYAEAVAALRRIAGSTRIPYQMETEWGRDDEGVWLRTITTTSAGRIVSDVMRLPPECTDYCDEHLAEIIIAGVQLATGWIDEDLPVRHVPNDSEL